MDLSSVCFLLDGDTDCHSRCAHRLRNDRVFVMGTVERADRGVRPYKNVDDLARAGGAEPRPYAAYGDRIS